MKNNNSNKKANIKTIVIFFACILLCAIVGYFCGFYLSGVGGLSLEEIINRIMPALVYGVPVLFVIVNVVFFILSISAIVRSKKLEKQAADDEEKFIDAGNCLSYPSLYTMIQLVFNIFMMTVVMAFIGWDMVYERMSDIYIFGFIGLYILFLIGNFVIRSIAVKATARMNPEKNGNIFDLSFTKKWEASCDEAEKLIMYKSAYKAYKVASRVCMILFFVSMILQILFNIGVLLSLAVMIIYISMLIAYFAEGIKLEKH